MDRMNWLNLQDLLLDALPDRLLTQTLRWITRNFVSSR